MGYMLEVANALKLNDDPYVIVYKSSKSGQAYMELQILRTDWDRSAGNDLIGILDKQGWAKNMQSGATCLDSASISISKGQDQVQVTMDYSDASIKRCIR